MSNSLDATTTPAPVVGDGKRVEAREDRVQRLSTGALLAVIGLMLVWAIFATKGIANIALSDAFDAVQLPTIPLPAVATVTICAVLVIGAAAAFISGQVSGKALGWIGAVAGLAVVVGFVAWAAGGSALSFTLTDQLRGTLNVATPLVLGALCGVMSERAGVVNVAIEGQFLTAAFTAAVVGSVTKSFVAAMFGAILAGVAMAAVLAVFAVKYLMDQVILGVVINLLASGLTGFLFNQLVSKNAPLYNAVPVLPRLPIPGLEALPFFGPIFFDQTALAYIAFLMVPAVWFLLFKTKWGLRVRSVGEHPHAADTVGINVHRTKMAALLVGGILAGLGGSFFTVGYGGPFVQEVTVGNGFIALAALIMGRWHPVLASLMAVFFGFVTQLGQSMNLLGSPIDSQFFKMLPYVATIIAVAGLVGRVRAPAADGIPFVKS